MLAGIDPLLVLDEFIADEIIDEVVGLIKPGKEAVVYLVRKHGDPPDLFAAKIYKDVTHRRFRNDSTYRAGRVIKDERTRRAVAKRTRHGKRAAFNRWVSAERKALKRLHKAGANVPRPGEVSGNVILMEFIGDEDAPAPMLCDTELDQQQAQRAFNQVVANLEIFLKVGIVHADLSPYNILHWDDAITIIDFPQAVDLYTNPNARDLFARDVGNVCDFFARCGVRCSQLDLLDRFKDRIPEAAKLR